ncbi:MAG TPA: hypothetical protein VFU49_00390 [Ktedonobacteraceae bacterium]|nr:hypothetical protein [Ktedonobacteraceae bacterium]
MTQLPGIEARISAQERMSIVLHARIEELSQDMTISFQQQVKYQAAVERELDIRFRHIDARLDRLEANMASKEDLASLGDRLKGDMASLESRMASKEDLASLEDRIKGDMASLESRMASKEDLASLEGRLKGDMVSLEDRLRGDMASLEGRILDAFKQLVTLIETRLPPQ